MGGCSSNEKQPNKATPSNMKQTPRKKPSKEQLKMQEAKERQKEAFMRARKEKEEKRAGDCEFVKGITQVQSDETPLIVLSKSTHFSLPVLRQLEILFNQISDAQVADSFIDRDELAEAMGLQPNSMLLNTIFRLFDATSSKKINFRTWVITLSSLSTKASMEEKMRFSFNIYDLNGDGTIDLAELHTLLESAVRENVVDLSDQDVREICDYTLSHVDADGNGQVDYEEYSSMIGLSSKFIESFSIDVERMCTKLMLRSANTPRSGSSGFNESSSQLRNPSHDNTSQNQVLYGGQLSDEAILERQDAFKNRKILFPDSEIDVLGAPHRKSDSESPSKVGFDASGQTHILSPLDEGEEVDEESNGYGRSSQVKARASSTENPHRRHADAQKEKMEMNMAKLARTPMKPPQPAKSSENSEKSDSTIDNGAQNDCKLTIVTTNSLSVTTVAISTPVAYNKVSSPTNNSSYWGNSIRSGGSGSYRAVPGRVSLSHTLRPSDSSLIVQPMDDVEILELDNRYVNSVCVDVDEDDIPLVRKPLTELPNPKLTDKLVIVYWNGKEEFDLQVIEDLGDLEVDEEEVENALLKMSNGPTGALARLKEQQQKESQL